MVIGSVSRNPWMQTKRTPLGVRPNWVTRSGLPGTDTSHFSTNERKELFSMAIFVTLYRVHKPAKLTR
ncbi:MAG TPA: hypothetical protein VJR26_01025, partial [Candidatus Acidoferrales bacterium]|nr:hypothetical protein [Candidatus Acidoferrales bacterium]